MNLCLSLPFLPTNFILKWKKCIFLLIFAFSSSNALTIGSSLSHGDFSTSTSPHMCKHTPAHTHQPPSRGRCVWFCLGDLLWQRLLLRVRTSLGFTFSLCTAPLLQRAIIRISSVTLVEGTWSGKSLERAVWRVEKSCHASSLFAMKLSPPFGVCLLQCLSMDMGVTPTLSYPASSRLALKLQTDFYLPKQADWQSSRRFVHERNEINNRLQQTYCTKQSSLVARACGLDLGSGDCHPQPEDINSPPLLCT